MIPMLAQYQMFLSQIIFAQRIEKNTRNFNEHTIGVHIRRTDDAEAMRHSRLETFIEAMTNELHNDAKAFFWLASDDGEVHRKLKDCFPGRVFSLDNSGNRSTKEGMFFGVLDMFALSKCRLILGSYYSSFSEMAARIANVPLRIVKS